MIIFDQFDLFLTAAVQDYLTSSHTHSLCGLTFTWWGSCGVFFFFLHKPNELVHSFFYSVLVSISVFVALSTVFHCMNSPDNVPLSHSVLPVLFLPYWSFQLYYLFMKVSFSPDIIRCG